MESLQQKENTRITIKIPFLIRRITKQNQLWINTRQLFTYYYELLLHFQVNIHSHTLKQHKNKNNKNRHGNFLSMMKTTCVDEERIQRVDSTYLYLQQKKQELRKMLRRKSQFIHPSFKENTARLCLLGSNIS